jgi:hypothetical protein
MPSILNKAPITKELRKTLPPNCVDLMIGRGESDSGIFGALWNLLGRSTGSIELAYRRGYDVGYDDGINKRKAGESLWKDGS